jgi:hypothetical protein
MKSSRGRKIYFDYQKDPKFASLKIGVRLEHLLEDYPEKNSVNGMLFEELFNLFSGGK